MLAIFNAVKQFVRNVSKQFIENGTVFLGMSLLTHGEVLVGLNPAFTIIESSKPTGRLIFLTFWVSCISFDPAITELLSFRPVVDLQTVIFSEFVHRATSPNNMSRTGLTSMSKDSSMNDENQAIFLNFVISVNVSSR